MNILDCKSFLNWTMQAFLECMQTNISFTYSGYHWYMRYTSTSHKYHMTSKDDVYLMWANLRRCGIFVGLSPGWTQRGNRILGGKKCCHIWVGLLEILFKEKEGSEGFDWMADQTLEVLAIKSQHTECLFKLIRGVLMKLYLGIVLRKYYLWLPFMKGIWGDFGESLINIIKKVQPHSYKNVRKCNNSG